jgi:N-methylhydantoinase B/oxoprolinase/acetone carboxylase alpha subunit
VDPGTDRRFISIEHVSKRFEAQGRRFEALRDVAGAPGVVLLNGTPQHPKRTVILRAGDVLTFRTPGGGGYGDPRERTSDRLAEDRSSGLVG